MNFHKVSKICKPEEATHAGKNVKHVHYHPNLNT